ncbi:hypothetical protein LCR01_07310 [Companilactobacillus crustorum]|uniref:Uncharacterized protein n=3 Tax=Companilactobacillus TaxID=2767879 RepID=A0A837RJU9_9LACO|nr:hypothetical protein [Companilactobacillus crustorum]HCD07559.1 hypothetical protein [Lactobacillus sp.]APU70613.1 hypothetical protein BI355_0256 [Companilactobacillus crustorum]KRK43258.1 hypothetical protein FD26_GL002117 [Companilactobacillus crustorum JCM 15951]KRO20843.1 hypothetical protein IV63_GL000173 [Companilactobacillus crustorum]WDT65230.1 hypothetical protein NV391_09700 [Companilactobacillus crustorum]
MSKKIIAVALDINNIPFVSDDELILTLEQQKIWYTTNTQAIEVPGYIKFFDNLINSFFKKFFKNKKRQNSLRYNYFTKKVSHYLKTHDYDEIIFENQKLKSSILPNFKNKSKYVAKDSSSIV